MSILFEKSRHGSEYSVKIVGIWDYSTIEASQDGLDIPDGITHVKLDFSRLEFIDSTGIGSILTLIYSAQEQQASIEFTGLIDEVKEIFDTVGVFRVMEALRKGGKDA